METEFGTYEDFRFIQSALAGRTTQGEQRMFSTITEGETYVTRKLNERDDLLELIRQVFHNMGKCSTGPALGVLSAHLAAINDAFTDVVDEWLEAAEELEQAYDDEVEDEVEDEVGDELVPPLSTDDAFPWPASPKAPTPPRGADCEPPKCGPKNACFHWPYASPAAKSDEEFREELAESAARAAKSACSVPTFSAPDSAPDSALGQTPGTAMQWEMRIREALAQAAIEGAQKAAFNKKLVDYAVTGDADMTPPEVSKPAPRNIYMGNKQFMADLDKLLDLHGYGKGIADTAAALYDAGRPTAL